MLLEQPTQLAPSDPEALREGIHGGFPPSRAPSAIRARARDTVFEVPRHEATSGAVSGRQRRHGRKPACWAAAAEGKKRQFSRLRRTRRADGPAVDAGGGHTHEEPAIEARVAGLQRAMTGVAVEQVHELEDSHVKAASARGFRT